VNTLGIFNFDLIFLTRKTVKTHCIILAQNLRENNAEFKEILQVFLLSFLTSKIAITHRT
jgi:hypothetical protein